MGFKRSFKLRAGKGKLRNRRHVQRRGPLVVYDPTKDGKDLVAAFRNLPGVETCDVYALNLLQLAPGGHLGRFVIWSSNAFAALDSVYGSTTEPSELKRPYAAAYKKQGLGQQKIDEKASTKDKTFEATLHEN